MTSVFLIISSICMFVLIVLFVFSLFFFCHIVCRFVLFYDLFILAFVSTVYSFTYIKGRRGRYRIVVRLKTTYAISAYHLRLSISNPVQDDVYSIQPCVIKFVRGLLQVGRFHRIPGFLLSIKLIPHDKAEIFLIMVLNTIAIHHPKYFA